MAIITISRGCFSHGKEVAEKVGAMLHYDVISRETLIEEAAQSYHVPEKELIKSIHAPSVLDRFKRGKEQYLSYIQAMFLEHAKKDNMVYHGHASHLLLPDIGHVLNVQILADIGDRIDFMQQQQRQITDKEAMRYITNEDMQRARWANYLYKMDITDPCLYDMVIHIKRLNIQEAAEMIVHAAKQDSFRTTPESRKTLANLALSSRVKATIENACRHDLKVKVSASSGIVYIRAEPSSIRKTSYTDQRTEQHLREKMKEEIIKEISAAIEGIPGIENIVYEVIPPDYV